jgi:predicted oxidoreductase (fatty acid repression mutant protein)
MSPNIADSLIAAVAERRSVYKLSGETTISKERLEEIVQKVLLATPSAFNTQSTRIVVLLGDEHRKLWDIVRAGVKPLVAAEQAQATESKIAGFQGAYGTILFFEDPAPFEPLQAFKMYADKFPGWREQTSGMHQLLVWTALEAEGLGANVQHYNPLIDEKVQQTWSEKIQPQWQLLSQMVIGKPVGELPPAKEKKPVEGRFAIIG